MDGGAGSRLDALRRTALTVAVALAAALLCQVLRTPLPWMIGPLLGTAALSLVGVRLYTPGVMRNAGQWVIGTALGLFFTPQVVAVLPGLAPAIAVGVVWALGSGYLFYRWLWRRCAGQAGIERPTAFFAAAIGGASEMAVLAERHGGRVDLVAAAHSLRVLIVVVGIPFAFQASGVHGSEPSATALQAVHPGGLAVLAAATLAGVALMSRTGLPNPFVLGSLFASMALTGAGIELSAMPRGLSNAGQLAIGVALGTRFDPSFRHAAPRWLGAVAVGTLVMIVVSGAFAWLLALATGLNPATLMLATSPGGIAEMCITAKVLELGVPTVTAFHVVRYLAVMVATRPMFRAEMARHR